MPQATAITVVDGATTPVSHVFTPSKQTQVGEMVFTNQSSSKLANRETLSVRVRDVQGASPAKVAIKLGLPAEAVVDGQTVRVQDNLIGIDFVISPESTAGERKARRVLAANLLLSEEVAAVIDNIESFF